MRPSRRIISPVLPIALSLVCLVVSGVGLLPHFHDAADSGHASSCVLHQAASATQAAVSIESAAPETPVFLWAVGTPSDTPSYRAHSLRNSLRGPPAATPHF